MSDLGLIIIGIFVLCALTNGKPCLIQAAINYLEARTAQIKSEQK